ncbi:MAG: aspartate--tRNA ligase [Nanoarchaeota archaeon]
MMRTHTCGQLRLSDDKKKVTLCGWNHSRRDHGGVIFIDLRDRYGLTQIVFDPSSNKKVHGEAEHLRREDIVLVKGSVRPRGPTLENPKLATGQIEIIAEDISIIAKSETPPIEIDDFKDASEEMRMKYRYLDLRRPKMQRNLMMRCKVVNAARAHLLENDFIELETPLLIKSTPEGARDYVVPSRVHPGKFYALPQSPQLYKQIFMIAGFDRYFQVAKCLRDEDLRADRQPEHTQIDVEMSFAEPEDIFHMIEGMIQRVFKDTINTAINAPFTHIPFDEAMDKYGCDKPDIRYDLHLKDVSEIVKKSSFGVFNSVLSNGGVVKCVIPETDLSRKQIDELEAYAQGFGAKGLAWMKVTDKGLESSIVKFFTSEVQKELLHAIGAKVGSTILFIADKKKNANEILNRLRQKLAKDLNLYDPKEFRFCWITDFPLFEWNEEENKWDTMHHLFCKPKAEHIKFLRSDPGKVKASLYDLVVNGVELCSGSIRISDPVLQEEIMDIIGYKKEDAHKRFGFLLEAYRYAGPPHGGVGVGLDRLTAMILGYEDIREVIAFPKTKSAECLMDGCPSELQDKELKELHLRIDLPKVKKG